MSDPERSAEKLCVLLYFQFWLFYCFLDATKPIIHVL